MITLRPQEETITIIRRHWINILAPILGSVFFASLPLILPFATYMTKLFGTTTGLPLTSFITICYWMVILAFFLIEWVDYYFDTWIVTTERVLDVNQVTLFRREISEFSIGRVQNVTVHVPNIVATLLRFGNITVETAGEKSFDITAVPSPEKLKELLVRQSQIYQASPFGHRE